MLLQLPVGAIPVANGQFTRAVPLDLEPYRTQTIDYLFYFPKAGQVPALPGPRGEERAVRRRRRSRSPSTWSRSRRKLDTDVVGLRLAERHERRGARLPEPRERAGPEPGQDRLPHEGPRVLRGGHAAAAASGTLYQPTLWSYGLLHADVPAARQFLLHADSSSHECGGPIDSPLLTIDPVARHQYEHLEYKPLVNARAHALGQAPADRQRRASTSSTTAS